MKLALKIAFVLVLVLLLSGGGVFAWATSKNRQLLTRTIETHRVDFPVPVPLSDAEIAELRADGTLPADGDIPPGEPERIARQRALERGEHLVQARYACGECHGADFGGGTMVDDPMIGRILGPNLTTGEGGVTAGYTAADWDRAVRHGVLPDGTPSAMPSEDFREMSDQELSDIVAYIRSRPPVDATVPEVSLGPLGRVLLATGQLPLSADMIESHDEPHAATPPAAEVSVEFGEHLAAVCTGCHGQDLTGGPIPGGAPSWAPAANLTSHADGLAGWTYEQFATAMKEGRRPDGTELLEPMTMIMPFAGRMTDTEMRALWTYLQSVPARPSAQ